MSMESKKAKYKYKSATVVEELPHLKDKKNFEDNISKLNHDLLNVYKKVSLKKEEVELREEIFARFKKVLEMEFAKENEVVEVQKYGSFMTGLMVGQSDIDITVLFPNEDKSEGTKYKKVDDVNGVLKRCFKMLLKHDLCEGEIVHIKKTKIPIIKCVDKEYQVKLDISVGVDEGVESGVFVVEKLQEHTNLKYLCILVKYFLKRRNLSVCYTGGLSAYGQFLLALNFIQLHPLADCADIKDNLGTYLMEFFLFYSEFNYRCAIVDVKNIRYKTNASKELFIDDPVTDDLSNVASNCTQFDRIRHIFETSYKIMAKALSLLIANKDVCSLLFKFNTKELFDREQNIKKFLENKAQGEKERIKKEMKKKVKIHKL